MTSKEKIVKNSVINDPTVVHINPNLLEELKKILGAHIWIGPSKPPKIDDNDSGIWRRIKTWKKD